MINVLYSIVYQKIINKLKWYIKNNLELPCKINGEIGNSTVMQKKF